MAPPSSATHPHQGAFPKGLSGPALRALSSAGIRSMADLPNWTETSLAALHGMGPKTLAILKRALEADGKRLRRR